MGAADGKVYVYRCKHIGRQGRTLAADVAWFRAWLKSDITVDASHVFRGVSNAPSRETFDAFHGRK